LDEQEECNKQHSKNHKKTMNLDLTCSPKSEINSKMNGNGLLLSLSNTNNNYNTIDDCSVSHPIDIIPFIATERDNNNNDDNNNIHNSNTSNQSPDDINDRVRISPLATLFSCGNRCKSAQDS